jgi:hypothetical protein
LVAVAATAMCVAGAADAAEVVTTVNWTRPASTGELYISFNIVAGLGQNPTSSATANAGWDIKVRSSGGQFIIEPFVPPNPGVTLWGVMQFPGSSGNAGNLPNDTLVYSIPGSNQSFNNLGGPVTFGSALGQWKLNTTSDALNGFGFKFKNNNAGVNQSHFGYMTVEFGATVDSWRIKKIAYQDAFGAAIVVEGTYGPSSPPPPDCDSNGVSDLVDVQVLGADVNGNGVLDRCEPVTPDINGNDIVDGADLGLLLAFWGSTVRGGADLDRNGTVDGADLGLMLAAWGGAG